MDASNKPARRLARLDQILSQSPTVAAHATADTDPGQIHLTSVPLERIRALTIELQERAGTAVDDLDAITMRLLLNDYKTAVAHLRAVANLVDARVHTTASELHAARKTVRREEEMAAKRPAQDE